MTNNAENESIYDMERIIKEFNAVIKIKI